MPSFYEANADLFSLGNGTRQESQQDVYARLRQAMSPEIQAQLNQSMPLGATPGQVQAPVAPAPQSISDVTEPALQALVQKATPADPQTGKQKPKEQQDMLGTAKEILSSLNVLEPKKAWGPPGIGEALGAPKGAGGILGLGITPLDVIMFAAGVGITRNMPQSQAIETTMKLAQLPNKFRENQEKSAQEFIKNAMGITQIETGQANAQTAQANSRIAQRKAAQDEQEIRALQRFADTERAKGNAQLADLMESTLGGRIVDRLDVPGLLPKTGAVTQNLTVRERGILAGKNIDPARATDVQIQDARARAHIEELELARGRAFATGDVRQDLPMPPADARAARVPLGTTPRQAAGRTVLSDRQMADIERSSEMLAQIQEAIALYDPKFSGPVQGRLGGLGETFGGISEREIAFRAVVAAIVNDIRNKRFGGALTPLEATEALKELPDLNKSDTSVKTKLQALEKRFTRAVERFSGQGGQPQPAAGGLPPGVKVERVR